jgi:hypothetical protein
MAYGGQRRVHAGECHLKVENVLVDLYWQGDRASVPQLLAQR